MYKIVLQIPDTDDAYETLADMRWIGEEGPYGPHVKTAYGKDAETGEEMLFVRLKHHTWPQVEELLEKAKARGLLDRT